MRSSDCAVKFCPRRDRTSHSRSCALLNLDDASEQLQNGVKPLINGLIEACKSDNTSIVVDTLNVWHESLP